MSGFDQERAPLYDRRHRAHEVFHDASCAHLRDSECVTGIEAAIETATRVRIDDDILAAYVSARVALNSEQMHGRPPKSEHEKALAGLIAAFRAAGFEVEQ